MTIFNIFDPTNPLHAALHHLDLIAAAFTASSTALLALRRRLGFAALAVGACLWVAVACLGRFGDRPIYGIIASSAVTITFACYGWWKWR